MMDKKDIRPVMERVTESCRRAYEAKMPLIMLDTVEYELVEEIALSGSLVALMEPVEDPYREKEMAYYRFLGERPDRLSRCANLYFSADDLSSVFGLSGNVDRAGSPCMFVIALGKSSSGEEQSQLRELRRYVRRYLSCRDNSAPLRCSCVLLYGDISALPEDLLPYTEIVEVPFPLKREIIALAKDMTCELGHEPLAGEDLQELASSLAGLGLFEARRLIYRLLSVRTERGELLMDDTNERKQTVLAMKKQSLLRNGGLLNLCEVRDNELAGMGAYTEWVGEKRSSMQDPEEYLLRRGNTAPRGVLLCGVPGCGKSEAAKLLYNSWDRRLPLLQLSVDQLMGGYVGDSERNMRMALKQAEAMAPCIVWIDELDKGFSAVSGGSGGENSTFKRMFGRLLVWMQENERPCFIFATANDISRLPDEFFRSGRFDELFSVFMPTAAECRAIFREQMRRADERRRTEAEDRGLPESEFPPPLFDNGKNGGEDDCEEFDCYSDEHCLDRIMAAFAENRKFLTGADIAKIVNSVLLGLSAAPTRPIRAPEWVARVTALANSPTLSTYGSGSSGMDGIAACYLRLLSRNFVPASRVTLFKKENFKRCYDENSGRVHLEYALCEGEEPPSDVYDRALYDALLERFPRIADRLENNALSRLCAD